MNPDELSTVIALSALSGRELAHLLGVSEMTVNRWEQGLAEPREAHRAVLRRIRAVVVGMSDADMAALYGELGMSPDPVKIWKGILE